MDQGSPPESPQAGTPLRLRILRALSEPVSSRPLAEDKDLFKHLDEAQKRYKETWPEATASGDGAKYLAQSMSILARRMRWRARIAIAGEIVNLLGRCAGVAIGLGIAWHLFVA